jgi:hypothetical protein
MIFTWTLIWLLVKQPLVLLQKFTSPGADFLAPVTWLA